MLEEEIAMREKKTATMKNNPPNILDLLRFAKSIAMDRDAERIEEEDLYEALRSFRLRGNPRAIREILEPFGYRKLLMQHTAGDRPLPADEFNKRLERAKTAGKLALSEEAWELAERIGKLGLSLAPAEPPSTLPPAVRAIADCEDALKAAVRGQDAALREIACRLRRPRPETGPAGVFVLAGAPGSGKSLTAQTMAKALGVDYYAFDCSAVKYVNDDALIRGSQSTYKEAKPGLLTDWVRQHPECVVELRNFEQMTPEVHGFLTSILDGGMLRDSYGFYPEGACFDDKKPKPVAPPEVDFRGARLVIEVHGCEDLYDRPEMLKRLREEEGGEAGVRRALVDALRSLEVRQAHQKTRIFGPDLMTRLESVACFCLFAPLDSATMEGIVREGLDAGLRETAERLGLALEAPPEAERALAAKMLLWERGGRAAAGAFAASTLADRLFAPLYDFLRQNGGAPEKLRLSAGAEVGALLVKIERELGAEPVQALYRGLKRLSWEPRVSLKGAALVLSLEKPELVRAPPVEDYGEGLDKLVLERPSTRFADVAGLDRVKARLKREVETQVRRWKFLKKKRVKAPGGILLQGAPGTGKTLLATACAGEFELPFLATTGTRLLSPAFQERVFALLKRHAPCLLFVDEIDAICAWDVAVEALQSHMDGFASGDAPPVYVIAATNFQGRLPEALKRAGRLGKAIEVPLPDPAARRALFAPVRRRLDEATLNRLLDFTAGRNGAELHAAVREMTLHKGKLDEATARDLLLDCFYGERLQVSDGERLRVAYHEAGHAALLLDNAERGLSDDAELKYITLSFREHDAAHVSREPLNRVFASWNRERVLREMAASLAGMSAQALLTAAEDPEAGGDLARAAQGMARAADSGARSDLDNANRLAHLAVTTGLDAEIGPLCASSGETKKGGKSYGPSRSLVERRMRVWLEDAERLARDTLVDRWPLVQALAVELLEKEALGRAEIDAIARRVAA